MGFVASIIRLVIIFVLYLKFNPTKTTYMKYIKFSNIGFILILALVVTSCAGGDARFDVAPAGFWAGLWHGFISLVTFIISLFNDKVDIYELNNKGKLYDLGFVLGAMMFYSGGARSGCRWRK